MWDFTEKRSPRKTKPDRSRRKRPTSRNQRNGQSGVNDLKDLELHLDLSYSHAEDILAALCVTSEQLSEYNTVTERLNEHSVVWRNVIFERAKFNMIEQEAGASADMKSSQHYTAQRSIAGAESRRVKWFGTGYWLDWERKDSQSKFRWILNSL